MASGAGCAGAPHQGFGAPAGYAGAHSAQRGCGT
jgi:hypothetical protein